MAVLISWDSWTFEIHGGYYFMEFMDMGNPQK
jgi:hypothetical protein